MKLLQLIATVMLFGLAAHCADFTEALETQTITDTGPGVTVKDANGQNLGKAIGLGNSIITLESPKGYTYYLNWDGSPYVWNFYYVSADCSDEPLLYASSDSWTSDFVLYNEIDDTFYIVDDNHTPAEAVTTGSQYSSFTDPPCSASSNELPFALELNSIDRSTAGIPGSIEAPLEFVD